MRHPGILIAALVLLIASCAGAQLQSIVIPAGTPEDKQIQAIGNEADAQKRVAMWQDFVQNFLVMLSSALPCKSVKPLQRPGCS